MSKNDALYLAKIKFEAAGLGGDSMILRLAADPIHQTLSGQAQGTILKGTEHSHSFIESCNGTTHSTGFGDVANIGAVRGQAAVSFVPPAIGTYLSPFSANFGVDKNWNGMGKFTVGDNTYECKVEKV